MIGQAGTGSPEAGIVRLALIPVFMFTPCGRGRDQTVRGPEQTRESSFWCSRPPDSITQWHLFLFFFTATKQVFIYRETDPVV